MALLAACGQVMAQPSQQRAMLASMRPMVTHAAGIGLQPGSGWIVLSGPIVAAMADALGKAAAQDRSLHSVLIDSGGGDLDAALRMATVLHERRMHLVVDGRCLSACASYLFPAAATKSVLPGSVLAIHGATAHYMDGGRLKSRAAGEAASGLDTLELAPRRAELMALLERAERQRRALGLRDTLDASFNRYLAHRKGVFGTDAIASTQHAAGCPAHQMWALDRAQLEAAGVTGIEEFWYPAEAAQRQRVAFTTGLAPDFFYYGPASGLEQLCTTPLPLLERVRLWSQRTVTALRGG